jgi:hypothetical protein
MALITRVATIVETPDPSQGGSGVSGAVAGGHGSTTASASSSGGGSAQTQRKTCRWRNFGPAISGIVKIVLKYDWSWSVDGSAELGGENGSASCSSSYFLGVDVFGNGGASISGPGPVSPDSYSDGDSGSSTIVLPNNTDLSALQLQTELFATAESGIPGSEASSSAQTGATVSNIKVEITTDDGAPIAFF